MRHKHHHSTFHLLFSKFLIFFLVFAWIFSGWPVVWNNPRIPPKIEEAQAAAINYYKNSFAASTAGGSQAITGVGFQPKAIIFFYTTQTAAGNSSTSSGYGMGFATASSTQRAIATYSVAAGTSDTARVSSETKTIIILSAVGTIGAAASLTSFDSNGFTIQWNTTPASAYIIHYVAIGGAAIANATAGTFSLTTGTGSLAVTGTGFKPDFLMFLGIDSSSASETIDANDIFHLGFTSGTTTQAGLSLYSRDGLNSSDTCSTQRNDNAVVIAGPAGTACNTVDALASLTSFDSDGFTLNKSDAPSSAVKVHYLALKGAQFKVGVFNSPTSSGNSAVTGVGFKPEGLMLASFARAASTAATANYYFGLGSTDGTRAGRISRADTDNDNNPDPDISTNLSEAFGAYTGNGTLGLVASLTSFDNDGFTLNWSTTQSTARQIIYWAIAGLPAFTQSAYRFFENSNSTDVGSPLAAQDTAASLSLAGAAFRLRALIHIGDSQLKSSGQSFKLQFAQRGADSQCDTSFSGETYSDVTTSTAIAYNDNSTPADGTALTSNANDPTHSSDTVVNQTYEELNNFTNSQAAIAAGQDGKWDFSLKDNNATPTAATYCLRVVKNDGTLLDDYSVIPQITTSNVTDYITGSLGKSSDSWYGAIPVYLQLHGALTSQNYPHARAKVDTAASETYYTSLTWNSSTSQFEGIIYVGSWYCNGCTDPTTGLFSVTVQLDNNSDFGSIDYSASAGTFTTFIVRRWNAINATAMGYGTEFNPTWNSSGGYWDYSIDDFSIGYPSSTQTNVAFAIPFYPTTATISNISVTLSGSSISQGTPASTTDCWWWDADTHTLYVQKASVAANTWYTINNISFRADTDLFMTRFDRLQTYNISERLFNDGMVMANQYVNTSVFGCGHEGAGEQVELTGRNFNNNDDVNLDCMERVAVHVDNTIRTDSSNYYSAAIKWKPNECTSWILSEDNNKIVWRVISDDTPSTGWAQQLNNQISATRTQEFYASKPYIKNTYEFKNNDTSVHIYPLVWGREQWLGTDRDANDQGRFAGDTTNRTIESTVGINTLPESWMTSYDTAIYAAMGVIFQKNDPARYGYFLSSAPILNQSPWAEWVNQGSEYRVDDNDSGTVASNTFFDKNWPSVGAGQTVSFTFWQWGYVTTSWTGIENKMREDYYETGGVKTTQAAYRFFTNIDSTDVGAPMADLNTAATTTSSGQSFRLRLLIRVETNDLLQNGETFKLQFATKTGASCGDDETFDDVSSSTPIAFYDNGLPSDGANLTSNANDPTDGGRTVRAQTYEEANNFTNAVQIIYTNEDGMWDFALKDNNAPAQTSYCFRALKFNAATTSYQLLNTYTVYPEVQTAPLSQSLTLTINPLTVNLGTLAPQIPVTATSSATVVITGYNNGYNLSIKRDNATSTLYLSTNPATTFPDYSPSWDPTANGGSGNATTSPGSVFSFRVMSSSTTSNYNSNWWGANDNEGIAKYAGMPTSSANIVVCTSAACQNGTTTSMLQYRVDAPLIQPIGNYTGTITITVLGNI